MKKKKNKNTNYIYYILGSILVFSIVVLLLYEKPESYDTSKILLDETRPIIYEAYKVEDNIFPVINLQGEDIKRINKEIIELYDTKNNASNFQYIYNVSKDTLSILIINNIYIDNIKHINYKSYIIDLHTMKELTNEEIYNKFEIDEETLNVFISSKFLNYYADLLDNGLDGNKCDYECFIYNCNFQDYLEDNHFYIEDNHLILYKYFDTNNKYNYSNFFTDESYRFVVK
ncbi:MAG: hypothetical protein IJ463_07455 [Bacilli bacterium]|nr:hypothetical protein [Bacilli bacterium]